MKQTVFISLSFTAGESTALASINIPFRVKKIHIKSAVYKAGTVQTTYVVLKSTLGLNAPLGFLFRDTTYSTPSIQDIEIELKNPEVIQGTYTFTIFNVDGTQATATVGNDVIGLIMEFNSE